MSELSSVQTENTLTLPKLRLKQLDEFSILLLVKLTELIDKEPESSAQLYHLIEQSLIRQTKNTLFTQKVQKMRKKHAKHKKMKKQKQKQYRMHEIKQLTSLYKKRFKKSYESIFYNIWVKILIKTYRISISQIEQDQKRLHKQKQRRKLAKIKSLSYNRIERLNYVINVLFEGGNMNPKFKSLRKKITKFIKGYEKMRSCFQPVQKANLILKNTMMQLLIPGQEDTIINQNEEQRQNSQAIVNDEQFVLVYQQIQDEILRKYMKNLPDKMVMQDTESTFNIESNRVYSQRIQQSQLFSEQKSLSILRPLVKKSSTKQINNKNQHASKEQDNLPISSSQSSQLPNYLPISQRNVYHLPASSESHFDDAQHGSSISPHQSVTYSDYYTKYNKQQQSLLHQKSYISNIMIQSSIQDDDGRFRAYKENLKWQIRSFQPNQKTHVTYFHVVNYFRDEDLDEGDRDDKVEVISGSNIRKKQNNDGDDQVVEVKQEQTNLYYKYDQTMHKSIKIKTNSVKASEGYQIKVNLNSSQISNQSQIQRHNRENKSKTNSRDLADSRIFEQQSLISQPHSNCDNLSSQQPKPLMQLIKQRYHQYSQPILPPHINQQDRPQIIKNHLSLLKLKPQTKSQIDEIQHNSTFNDRPHNGRINYKRDMFWNSAENANSRFKQQNKITDDQKIQEDNPKNVILTSQPHPNGIPGIRQLFPRAYGVFLPLINQYQPNLPPQNKNIYLPLDDIENSSAIQEMENCHNYLPLQTEKKPQEFPNIEINNIECFGWLELEKEEIKTEKIIREIQAEQQKSKSKKYIHQSANNNEFKISNGQNQNGKINERRQIRQMEEIMTQDAEYMSILSKRIDLFILNYFMHKNWAVEMKKSIASAYLQNQSIPSVKRQLIHRIRADLLRIWLQEQNQSDQQQKQFELRKFLSKLAGFNQSAIKTSWILRRLYDLVNQILYGLRNSVMESPMFNNPNNVRLYMSYKILKKMLPIPASVDLKGLEKYSLLQAQIRKINLEEIPSSKTWLLDRPSFPILLKPNAIEMNLYLLQYFVENRQNQVAYVQKIGFCLEKMQIMQKLL